jgi:hypothetical protein
MTPECRSVTAVLLQALIAATLSACSKKGPVFPPDSDSRSGSKTAPWFEEVSSKAGVSFRMVTGHRPGHYLMPEIKGGGLGLLDYDNDGLLDIFCVQTGSLYPDDTNRPTHQLFHNLGNWRFEEVSKAAGVAGGQVYGMGCACTDFNGDGYADVYVTALGGNTLYRNNGNGTFSDVTTEAGVRNGAWSMSAAFFDYDGDGHLDLVMANYVKWSTNLEMACFSQGGLRDYCSPLNYKAPSMITLYHNLGNGRFEDATLAAGLDKAYGYGLGIICQDFNGDGRPDIFVANDATPNQLWMNQGNGTFVDEGMLRGCAVNGNGMCEAGMGVAVADLFGRGAFDLFVTHLTGEANRLFYNRTNGYFSDLVTQKGPGATSWPYTSFGVGFVDFDNDGILDLYVANGRVKRGLVDLDPKDPYAEPNNLFHGLGEGEFQELFPQGGTEPPLVATSRGAAFGDLDNDGRVDVVVANRDGPTHVLRNITSRDQHWITFKIVNKVGSDAIGAVAELQAGDRKWWAQVQPNQSYCSSNDPRIHYGLGAIPRVERLKVRWPEGNYEVFGPFQPDQIYLLRQGQGAQALD